MRMTLARPFFALFILFSALAGAQSSSPDALYERGIDAITGVGESHNDQLGVDYFHRSADLGYGPAQIALGYYYEMGLVVPANQGNPGQLSLDLYKKSAQQGDPRQHGWRDGVTSSASEWTRTSTPPKNG